MLNYEEFQSYVEESILDFLPEQYENAIVSINTITKNNGKERKVSGNEVGGTCSCSNYRNIFASFLCSGHQGENGLLLSLFDPYRCLGNSSVGCGQLYESRDYRLSADPLQYISPYEAV